MQLLRPEHGADQIVIEQIGGFKPAVQLAHALAAVSRLRGRHKEIGMSSLCFAFVTAVD